MNFLYQGFFFVSFSSSDIFVSDNIFLSLLVFLFTFLDFLSIFFFFFVSFLSANSFFLLATDLGFAIFSNPSIVSVFVIPAFLDPVMFFSTISSLVKGLSFLKVSVR